MKYGILDDLLRELQLNVIAATTTIDLLRPHLGLTGPHVPLMFLRIERDLEVAGVLTRPTRFGLDDKIELADLLLRAAQEQLGRGAGEAAEPRGPKPGFFPELARRGVQHALVLVVAPTAGTFPPVGHAVAGRALEEQHARGLRVVGAVEHHCACCEVLVAFVGMGGQVRWRADSEWREGGMDCKVKDRALGRCCLGHYAGESVLVDVAQSYFSSLCLIDVLSVGRL